MRCSAVADPKMGSMRAWKPTDSIGQLQTVMEGMHFFYNFGRGSGALYRQSEGEKQAGFAVRCIRD